MEKKIVLTGGGTAGHVNPNIALISLLKEKGFSISYIGSHEGIERKLISEIDIPYFPISTGKLRRYFDTKNFTDVFRVIKGIGDAKKTLKGIRPNIVFSKGGFVSVPVVLAAHSLGIPVIIHESDATPGLANKISFKFSKKICASFPETIKMLPEEKAVLTGSPIRETLAQGCKEEGLKFCNFTTEKPVIMIMGGSIGSVYINQIIHESLEQLLNDYNVIHLCGKGNYDANYENLEGYRQFEYIGKELGDLFAATDIVISRSGANAIFEILSLNKPNILIPLPSKASRGDQIVNAISFAEEGYSYVLLQENLTKESLIDAVDTVYKNKDAYIDAMKASRQADSINRIVALIEENLKA